MPLPTRTPEAGEGREGHGGSASQRIAGASALAGKYQAFSASEPAESCRMVPSWCGKMMGNWVGMGMHGLRYAELRTGIWHVIRFWPLRGMNHKFRATAWLSGLVNLSHGSSTGGEIQEPACRNGSYQSISPYSSITKGQTTCGTASVTSKWLDNNMKILSKVC